MVASRWVWGLLGSVAVFSGTTIAIAQEEPIAPILVAQRQATAQADLLFDEGYSFFEQGTAEGYQTAISKWQTALAIYEQQQNDEKIALTNLTLGFVYDNLGYKQQALTYYEDSFFAYQRIGDHYGVAVNLNNIGGIYDAVGEKRQALEFYQQALPLFRTVSDLHGEAATLNNIGRAYNALGEKQEALDFYQQSLSLSRAADDHYGEATTLNNIGAVYNALGEKQQALDFYQQALSLRQAVGDRSGEATTLNNIGRVYDDIGEKQQALDFFQQSLSLSRAVGDRSGEALTLNNIGAIYDDIGEKQQALDFYQQALSLSRAVGDRSSEAATLHNIGRVYNGLGEKQEALNFYQQALPLRRAVGDRSGEATTLNNIGAVYNDLEEKQQALNFFQQALSLSRTVGDRSGEARTLYNIAFLEKQRSNLSASLQSMEASIAILEDLRTNIASKELRQTYFSTLQSYYRFHIELLMDLHRQAPSEGYDQQAFEASEKSRARILLELLTESNAGINANINPALQQREIALTQRLNQIEQQRLTILGNPVSTDVQEHNINQQLDQILQEFQTLENEIRLSNPKYADIQYPEPISVAELQRNILDQETALLQYSLSETKSYLWVVTKNDFQSYELPNQQVINDKMVELLNAITSLKEVDPNFPAYRKNALAQTRQQLTHELSQLLLPAAEQLAQKRLVIVPDGELNYFPFGVLFADLDTNTTLSAQFELVNLPSSSTIASIRRQDIVSITDGSSLSIFADPVFSTDDCRFNNAPDCDQERLIAARDQQNRAAREFNDSNWDDLPGTFTEANNILNFFPNEQNVKSAFGFAAQRENIVGDRLQDYDIVHFATHGFFHPTKPEQSGLVFSLVDEAGNPQNGFLRLGSIFNLQLNAALVVLSACQTGIGAAVPGEGMVGMSRGFMYAGTPRLLMSLWKVDDLATAEFMTRFYRNLVEEQLTPSTALKETQREMREETEWSHPQYWAAFILQGEWN